MNHKLKKVYKTFSRMPIGVKKEMLVKLCEQIDECIELQTLMEDDINELVRAET